MSDADLPLPGPPAMTSVPVEVEIAAGDLQLLPASAGDRVLAEAAGLTVGDAAAVWTAHDAVTADPRAFVVLRVQDGAVRVAAVAGPAGSGRDAVAARDVVRRYACDALGLADG